MTDIDVKYKAFDRNRQRIGRKTWKVREAIDHNLTQPDPLIWFLIQEGEPWQWVWNERSQLFEGSRKRAG